MEQQIEKVMIRQLTTGDMLTVVSMLTKVYKIQSGIANIFTSDNTNSEDEKPAAEKVKDMAEKIGHTVIGQLLEFAQEDLCKWFASLLNKTVDEYLAMPINTTMDIVEQIVEGEENIRFLERAFLLSNKTSRLKAIFTKGSNRSNTTTGS